MYLNTLQPAKGAKKNSKRLGRGIGSGKGKTCGRGHKGQHARAGGFHKIGFEGGQMPLQRRLPKFGFSSQKARETEEIRLSEINRLSEEVVDLKLLRERNLIGSNIKYAKIIKCGLIEKPVTIKGIKVTVGAKEAIEKAGGKVEG